MTPRQRRKERRRRAEALAVQRAEFVLRFGCTQQEWQARYAETLGMWNFGSGYRNFARKHAVVSQ